MAESNSISEDQRVPPLAPATPMEMLAAHARSRPRRFILVAFESRIRAGNRPPDPDLPTRYEAYLKTIDWARAIWHEVYHEYVDLFGLFDKTVVNMADTMFTKLEDISFPLSADHPKKEEQEDRVDRLAAKMEDALKELLDYVKKRHIAPDPLQAVCAAGYLLQEIGRRLGHDRGKLFPPPFSFCFIIHVDLVLTLTQIFQSYINGRSICHRRAPACSYAQRLLTASHHRHSLCRRSGC